MYKRIPLDGSKLSEGVLPYVGFLAGRLRLPVNLLHVNDSETTVPTVYGTDGPLTSNMWQRPSKIR